MIWHSLYRKIDIYRTVILIFAYMCIILCYHYNLHIGMSLNMRKFTNVKY